MIAAATKGHSIISKLICFITGEPASHFVLIFNRHVAQINFLGGHITDAGSFFEKNKIIKSVDFNLGMEKSNEMLELLFNEFEEKSPAYDFWATFYTGYRSILYRIFKIKFPRTNKWGRINKSNCVNLIEMLPREITKFPLEIDPESRTPMQILEILENAR